MQVGKLQEESNKIWRRC